VEPPECTYGQPFKMMVEFSGNLRHEDLALMAVVYSLNRGRFFWFYGWRGQGFWALRR
jgi:hypothetical protein